VHPRDLPSTDAVLISAAALIERHGRVAATEAIREVLADLRSGILAGTALPEVPTASSIAALAAGKLEESDRPSLAPLFNLTGTVLHTNLGRALLAEEAIAAATAAMGNPVALEYDVEAGGRGERDDHVRGLLLELTGAEDATVVNNNAAAVLLALNTLAKDRGAIVSRGELIEIGGAFRMPDIMAQAGARLVEIGTTNRTHAKDYRAALGPDIGVILKVHTSNYRIQGFTAEVEAPELARMALDAGVPLLNDLGSGSLIDLSRFGLKREPTVREAVAEGADLVTFSGDKLLGGPQAGFMVGRRDLIAAINRNPMKRALRVDKIRLAAIEATLKLYRDPDRLAQRLPTLAMLARPLAEIEAQAARLAPVLARAVGDKFGVSVCACQSQIGSGALPLDTLPSAGLAVSGSGLNDLAAALRRLPRPVIGHIADGRLLLDLRCLRDEAGFVATLETLS